MIRVDAATTFRSLRLRSMSSKMSGTIDSKVVSIIGLCAPRDDSVDGEVPAGPLEYHFRGLGCSTASRSASISASVALLAASRAAGLSIIARTSIRLRIVMFWRR